MKTDKELYRIFSVDICRDGYAINFALIGAFDIKELKKNLPDILEDYGKSKTEVKRIMKSFDDYPPEAIEGAYTDRPYVILTTYSYYE